MKLLSWFKKKKEDKLSSRLKLYEHYILGDPRGPSPDIETIPKAEDLDCYFEDKKPNEITEDSLLMKQYNKNLKYCEEHGIDIKDFIPMAAWKPIAGPCRGLLPEEALDCFNKRLPIIALEKLLDKSFKYIVLQEDLIDINSAAEHSGVYGLKGYAVIDLFKFPELREVIYRAVYKYLTEKES